MHGVKIYPLHWSRKKAIKGGRKIKPHDMERVLVSHELSDVMTNTALSIFADCTNAGIPFQDAVAAVYLSGLQHGAAA